MSRKFKQSLLAVGFGIFWALLIAEVGARVLAAQGTLPNRAPADLFTSRPFGWSFLPDIHATIPSATGFVRVETNQAGFRDDDYAPVPPEDKSRILVLGDSFVAGLETAQDKMFHTLLESRLAERAEIIAMGVSGYPPAQEYLVYQDVGRSYSPDTVILMLYVGNDITGSVPSDDLPYYSVESGEFKLYNYPFQGEFKMQQVVITRTTPLMRLSELAFLVGFSQQIMQQSESLPSGGIDPAICERVWTESHPQPTEESWETVEALLLAFRDTVEADGSEFRVAIIPARMQIDDVSRDDLLAGCTWEGMDDDSLALQARLTAFMDANNISYLDLYTPLHDAATVRTENLYLTGVDPHWTPRGHEVVADALYEWLKIP